jgi:hypothetical protein
MAIPIMTPTGTKFEFEINFKERKIIITSRKGNQHEYRLRALKDLYVWLKNDREGNWVDLGSRGEEETPNPKTVEEWARSKSNPVAGFYGLTQGRRGRFASYIPSVLEYLGFVEVEHKPKKNRVRAL